MELTNSQQEILDMFENKYTQALEAMWPNDELLSDRRYKQIKKRALQIALRHTPPLANQAWRANVASIKKDGIGYVSNGAFMTPAQTLGRAMTLTIGRIIRKKRATVNATITDNMNPEKILMDIPEDEPENKPKEQVYAEVQQENSMQEEEQNTNASRLYREWILANDFVPLDSTLAHFTGKHPSLFGAVRNDYSKHRGWEFARSSTGWTVISRDKTHAANQEVVDVNSINEAAKALKILAKAFADLGYSGK